MSLAAVLISALVAAVVVGGVVTAVLVLRQDAPAGGTTAASTVRRLILYALLFTVVIVGATGVTGLLARLLDAGSGILGDDSATLARSFASTLVGVPAAGVLWTHVWRRAAAPAERAAPAWGVYVAGMSIVSLVVSVTAASAALAELTAGSWRPRQAATALVWAAVWWWHLRMAADARRGPQRLRRVYPTLGWVFGLAVGVGGAVAAAGFLLTQALRILVSDAATVVGAPWWHPAAAGAVWAAGGAIVWLWHSPRSRRGAAAVASAPDGRPGPGLLAGIAVLVVGVLSAAVLTLAGAARSIFLLLRQTGLDGIPDGGRAVLVDGLGYAVAAALLGAAVWIHHDRIAGARSAAAGYAARLVASGPALLTVAAGVGVVANALLAEFGAPLAGFGARTVLVAGIAALAVGAPAWWVTWRPARPAPSAADLPARRIYLVAIFGVSAVAALVTLLVLGFRLFEFAFESAGPHAVVDRVRAPAGLLFALLLVAGYHFSIWRTDRAAVPARGRRIGQVVLVAAVAADEQKRIIGDHTGAAVTVWRRAAEPVPAASGMPAPAAADQGRAPQGGPSAAALAAALDGVAGKRVLVITGHGSDIDVVPLAD